MKTLKKHIIIAIIICTLSITIYTIFQFISTKILFEVGDIIESLFGFTSRIDVDDVRSYIITLSSGIFISTIVALIFYLNEYRMNKEKAIRRIIDINQEICQKYSKLTYIAYTFDTELGKLAISYYLEFYHNKLTEYIKSVGESYIKQLPKKNKRVLKNQIKNNFDYEAKYEKQNKLKEYLHEHPEELIVGHGDNEHIITVEQKLSDIVKELDYKLELMLKIYQELMEIDLNELLELEQEASQFLSLNRKQMREVKEAYDDVSNWTDLLDYKNPAKTIYSIHSRSIKKIRSAYNYYDISECKEYNKIDIINFVLHLQKSYISKTYFKFLDTDLEYNHFLYIQNSLNQILRLKLKGNLTVIDKNNFLLVKNQFEDGYRTHIIFTDSKELYGDIYKE